MVNLNGLNFLLLDLQSFNVSGCQLALPLYLAHKEKFHRHIIPEKKRSKKHEYVCVYDSQNICMYKRLS